MPREMISQEERKREAAALMRAFERAQLSEPSITQESIANEMDVTQGLVNQWLTGRTPIPDKRLVWLSRRLNFNPADIRHSLKVNLDLAATDAERRTMLVYLTNPDFRRMVDAIAETGGFYEAAPQSDVYNPPKKGR
jgi:transcriptional regulator with XRE-family HTH domain